MNPNSLKFFAKRVSRPHGAVSGDPRVWPPGELCVLASGYDALAAENERLRAQVAERDAAIEEWSGTAVQNGTECNRLAARVAELEGDAARWKRDSELLSAIEGECWDVRFLSTPNADAGDSSISIEIVGHFMAAPCERVVGENYNENLRAALEQAMTAEAYPPARPEYDERGRPAAALVQPAKEAAHGM